jgi:hypothetical protein
MHSCIPIPRRSFQQPRSERAQRKRTRTYPDVQHETRISQPMQNVVQLDFVRNVLIGSARLPVGEDVKITRFGIERQGVTRVTCAARVVRTEEECSCAGSARGVRADIYLASAPGEKKTLPLSVKREASKRAARIFIQVLHTPHVRTVSRTNSLSVRCPRRINDLHTVPVSCPKLSTTMSTARFAASGAASSTFVELWLGLAFGGILLKPGGFQSYGSTGQWKQPTVPRRRRFKAAALRGVRAGRTRLRRRLETPNM